jgi:hypothetical protein
MSGPRGPHVNGLYSVFNRDALGRRQGETPQATEETQRTTQADVRDRGHSGGSMSDPRRDADSPLLTRRQASKVEK